ncbi:MAG: helix-turn-helix transcriptional regulator [Bacteroidia bacterium]|nr:helix-turn-helix transcriptional regulator [Bacteroidia bacterium]MCX6325897.1 helix-turn-helix transcriptional regulator [Bacteroidia bacterium]
MKERLLEFLKSENKSSAQLAEEIGVQPSGISHILSGRNNPSLDFVLKMLEKYQYLSTDWLLFGKGSMYKDIKMQSLFGENSSLELDDASKLLKNVPQKPEIEFQNVRKDGQMKDSEVPTNNSTSLVEKIVWFYDNNSFEEYFPSH